MELDRYEQEALRHCDELVEELEAYGIDQLAESCSNISIDAFASYCTQHASTMCTYLEKPPSKRKVFHKERPPADRAVFVLGVLFHARCGLALLRAITQYGVEAGPSYRFVSSRAAQAAYSYFMSWPTYWPFEDGNDPFNEGP